MEQREIITKAELINQLKACGLTAGQTVMVHSSIKSLGFVVGGPETVIRALLEIVGEEGTIMMPSQTWKNLDPRNGVHWEEPESWWPIIRENWPAYDKAVTPAIGMGVIAEMFCKWPGVWRSDHPARSVAAVGKYAEFLTEDHDLSNIFGDNSPIDKLYQLDGYILLLGVGYNKNTSFHLAETRASFSSKKFTTESSAIWMNGKREWASYETQDVDDVDFLEIGAAYDDFAQMPIHKVGQAQVRFMKQRPLVDFTVSWMEKYRK